MPRTRSLPRLAPEAYRGRIAVHWVFSINFREKGWLDPVFHARFREVILHACCRFDVVAPVYCLMPDHIHLMAWGMSTRADLRKTARFVREHTAEQLHPATYQKQPYDHVLREKERERGAFSAVCHYVLENPVRAGIARIPSEYPFSGAVVPGYPSLDVFAEDYWEKFWRICYSLMEAKE